MSKDLALQTDFGLHVRDHLSHVQEFNAPTLDAVADRVFRVVTEGHRIHVSGSGHSVASVLETFFRAGGLACVNAVYHPSLIPLNGGGESTLTERTSGFATLLVSRSRPTPDDIAFMFSHSGVNAYPVEYAEEMHQHGAQVVAVMSRPHSDQMDPRVGRKLGDVADWILDTRVPYGDATYPAGDAVTAGISSIVNVFLWDLLLVRLADRANAAGVQLPIWTSSNIKGGDERNRALLDRYRKMIPLL